MPERFAPVPPVDPTADPTAAGAAPRGIPEASAAALAAAPPRRLLPSLSLMSLVVYAALSAVLSVLLPNQIALLGEEDKVANLAAVTSVSFAFTIFAQPLVGALSDRPRGRLG